MASKIFSTNTTGNGFTLKLTLTEGTQDIANNQTPVSYTLILYNGGYNFSGYQIGYSVSLGGSVVASQAQSSAPIQSMMDDYMYITLCSGTTTIKHNDDGTKSLAVAFSINMNSASYTPGPMSGSGTMNLTPIARASKPTLSVTQFTMGDTITIYTNRKSSSFVHFMACYNNSTGVNICDIGTSVGDYKSWDTSALFKHCKNVQSLDGYILVVTYNLNDLDSNGAAKEVGRDKVNFKATIPNTATYQPTVSMTLSAPPTKVGNLDGLTEYIQSNFNLTATISATPKKHAGISKYALSVGGAIKSATSATVTSDFVHKSGDVEVIATATDTREFSGSDKKTINVTPYGVPYISGHISDGLIQCYRCDADGIKSDGGTALKFHFSLYWYSLKSGTNELKGYIQLKRNGYESKKYLLEGIPSGGGASNGYKSWYAWDNIFAEEILDADKSYTAVFTFVDSIGVKSKPLECTIPSAKTCFHLGEGGNKAAFGEYAEEDNTLSVAKDWKLKAKGGIEIEEAVVADHIVESGTSGIWTYEKRNSGVCVLYANISFLPPNTGYVHKTYAYPFTIKSAPIININITKNMTVCKEVYPANSGGNYTSEYTTLDVSFYNIATTDYAVYASVQVVSRWK